MDILTDTTITMLKKKDEMKQILEVSFMETKIVCWSVKLNRSRLNQSTIAKFRINMELYWKYF